MTATAHWTLLAPGTASDMSGGHQYNRRICAGLTELGQPTDLRYLPGHYPQVDLSTVTQAAAIFNALPVGSKVIVDGLAFGALPELMKTQARRLHLFALVHLPLADETGLMPVDAESLRNGEIAALSVATGVMVTSAYCARRLQAYGIAPSRVRSVPPGVDIPLAFSKAPSGPTLQLLCVANITPRKAQHVLLAALNDLQDLPWHCTLIGSLTHAPDYVAQLQQQISHCGLQDRLTLTGSLPHDQVTSYYRQTDVFVLPSVFETYGMVITEALAHGLPLVTTTGGALVDTVPEGSGLCVPPNDVSALQAALREVIAQPTTRQNLAARAVAACQHFSSWSEAARLFHHAINDLAHQIPTEPHPGNEREYFSGEWLALRQAADHQARATPLNEQLLTALKARYSPTSTTINVVDLGTGSGSNVRYLAPRLQTALPWLTQKWTLVDHDPELLNQARTACNDLDLTLIPLQADLRALDELPWPGGVDLITASALLDLVSADWAQTLAQLCARHACPLLITLSYDGTLEFSTPLPDDVLVRDTVNAHQQGEGVFGPSLGPTATAVLAQALTRLGFTVQQARSPWHLPPSEAPLQSALIKGWADACREQSPALKPRFDRWEQARLAQTKNAETTLWVGHLDLLALPPGMKSHAH